MAGREGRIKLTSCSGTGLIIGSSPFLRDGEALGARNDSAFFQISFVADNHHGDIFFVLDANNLLPQALQLAQRRGRRDAENKQETLARLHIQVSHGHYSRVSWQSCGRRRQRFHTKLLGASGIKAIVSTSVYVQRGRDAHTAKWKLTFLELPVDPGEKVMSDTLSTVLGQTRFIKSSLENLRRLELECDRSPR